MIRNLKPNLINFIFLLLLSCSQQKSIFQKSCIDFSEENNVYTLLDILDDKGVDELEKLRSDLKSLDVSLGLGGMKEERFLYGLDEYLFKYNHDSYELLLLTQYLRVKYSSTNELYDKMLKASIMLDNSNFCALYLLAKLRYENEFYESSFRIISFIVDNFDKEEVLIEFENLKSKMNYNKSFNVNIDEILNEQVYYND